MLACLMSLLPLVEPGVPVEPLAHVTHERAALSTAHYSMPAHVFREYRPSARVTAPGGDLADDRTLARVLPSAAADGEVMLLCIGGEGASRTGLNLVLNFRDMGLHNMLILAPARPVCARLWEVTPELACVWWPAAFKRRRPPSLYNTKFNPTALAFFEARKILLEKLVIRHRLNVLHLDADSLWFANPMPLFKTVCAERSQRPRARDAAGASHAPLTPPSTTPPGVRAPRAHLPDGRTVCQRWDLLRAARERRRRGGVGARRAESPNRAIHLPSRVGRRAAALELGVGALLCKRR